MKENTEQIIFKTKGGNSPVRFFLMLNDEKIGMAQRANKRNWEKDLWTVDVYRKEYMEMIEQYMFNSQKIERFYWGFIPY